MTRERCEEDTGGLRACCGTRQLGPHGADCPLSLFSHEAMADHEQLYAHQQEVTDMRLWRPLIRQRQFMHEQRLSPPGDWADALVLDREHLGRIVRETWVRWALEQPDPKPSWLVPWDDLDDAQREVDMRIGEAVIEALVQQEDT